MADPTTGTSTAPAAPVPPATTPAPAMPVLRPDAVLAALAHPTRLTMLLRLAEAQPLNAAHFARELRGNFDTISKHLRIMRRAGLIVARRPEEDERCKGYSIPAACLATPGTIDYGVCTLRTATIQARRAGH